MAIPQDFNRLQPGLYDTLLDQGLQELLRDIANSRLLPDIDSVDSAEIPDRVGEVIGLWAKRVLAAVPAADRTEAAAKLSESLLTTLKNLYPDPPQSDLVIGQQVSRLRAIEPMDPMGGAIGIARPLTPLRDTVLMTNGRGQPSLSNEIAAEIESADRIDIIVAFVRWSGIRQIRDRLRKHVEDGKPLRVITTTYTGTTELRALEELEKIGAQIKVSYDVGSTRLHAKAWMFHRTSGFSTIYIGSSNLTHTAQATGLEWNVRASQRLNPDLIDSFDRTFATYWQEPHFENFDAERFSQATGASTRDDSILTPFTIEPYPFQRQMLDLLQLERDHGFQNNLIVAATGTGKTVVAALDYRRLQSSERRARLLFVAHRSEILDQSRAVFRHALNDGSFGELWVSGHRPERWEHVFASIQSLNAADVSNLDPERFDVVIIDEFHHAAAATYEALLNHVRPKFLLGLTATPERADGLDILSWFDGRTAVELRLWDALEQGLLSPFHYFGIHDGQNLSSVGWRRGTGYDVNELTDLYTNSQTWIASVIGAVKDKVSDPTRMRALGFCVSIRHAEFMAEQFQRAGISAHAITSNSSHHDRDEKLAQLRRGETQVLFTVDLFNEGVDVPSIDVVLMLRPTDSATIFLQQLGRGLRRTDDKDVLTVLDFVGHQHQQFRFDLRFRALLGRSRKELEADIEADFPFLPPGCHINLDAVSRDIVLDNVKNSIPNSRNRKVQELRSLGDVSLKNFLDETGLEPVDIYQSNSSWTELRRAADLPVPEERPGEEAFRRGIQRTLHYDDQERIDRCQEFLRKDRPPQSTYLDESDRRRLSALLLTLRSPTKNSYESLDEALADLWHHQAIKNEMVELLDLLDDQITHIQRPIGLHYDIPLQVHATYSQAEILSAFGVSTVTNPARIQAGVYWHSPTQTDLLFVTLEKSEKYYSPTTRYLDYAISDDLFHWESQANTSASSETARRYLNHESRGSNVVLFVRTARKDAASRTKPYLCAGTAKYVEHRSERPIQITWRLDHKLPGDVFAEYRAAVA